MLNYSVKLGRDNFRRGELVWGEKYLAPDLSFISGVTSQSNHIDKKDSIAYSIGNETNSGFLLLSCENVTRNGYIKIVNKAYDILSGSTVDNISEEIRDYKYVEINGIIYYITGDTITINNWLKEEWTEENGEYKVNIVEGDVGGDVDGDFLYLDTIVWIEDETVTIDGDTYLFDRYDVSGVEGSVGGIRYYEDGVYGDCLVSSAITLCDSIQYNHFDNESDYIYVTKFVATKKEQMPVDFDRLSHCTYFYYVKYKNNYCPVSLSGDTYVCEVPKRLVSKITERESGYYNNKIYQVYDTEDSEPVGIEKASRISLLKNLNTYITVEGQNLNVDSLLQNANYGDEIGVYLTYDATNITVGDIITLEDGAEEEYVGEVYDISGETFAMYDNEKYKVQERLCDKVVINDHEYPIEYIYGLKDGYDALVDIMGEMVPMKIISTDDGKYSGGTLQRYGKIVSGTSRSAITATYDIRPYSGVTINGNKYPVIEGGNESSPVVVIGERLTYEFQVISIEGSSLLVCTPNFNAFEFDDEFRDRYCANVCEHFVTNQDTVMMYVKDRAFGFKPIKDNIGYANGELEPLSSNDYYNLFDNLILYSDFGYIHIPLKLDMNVANNILQDDIVERDFYEAEKKKAINDIVDMEKDVYLPKYMVGKSGYTGSNTVFEPISQIEVNLHFRTRNLDNWKVYDGYNDVSASGTSDNWFVTDYFPYNKLLEDRKSAEILQNSSDLMGLLYFTDDDIFYQRSKVGKSFLRFSYYDSTDPQTQSLLATSCVFVDEHKLYKTFIDNSRKRVFNYGNVLLSSETRGTVENKINVMTEFIGGYNRAREDYGANEVDMDILSADTRRISSKLIINNKYETDTSSEGFYLYMFKEYSENLHPKPIYMKVEFNHAGVGRTIPFIIPMHWKKEDEYYNNNNVNILSPERRLTLANDLDELTMGYPLSQVYAQTYIPLYAVYDFRNKEYAYVFDERYITSPIDNNGRAVLNLFELKIRNENECIIDEEECKNERKDVTLGIPERAIININTKQFDTNHFGK